MVALPSDYTIIGTVLAISVAIILISGLALYISFRVKETLREEKGRGAKIAKVGILIGLLFLSGGVFYFFAAGFGATSSTVSTSQTTTTSHHSSTTTSTSSSSTSTTSTSGQSVTMNVQCPNSGTSVAAGSTFYCTVTVYNTGTTTYTSATLVSSSGFTAFAFQSCSETLNGISESCTVASSTEISMGSIGPGTTQVTIGVMAPTTSGQKTCALTMAAAGLGQTITSTFTIQVTAR